MLCGRVTQSGDDDQEWPGNTDRLVVEQAVEPIMVSTLATSGLGTVHANLKPSSHVAVHGLPVAAAGEPMRWSACHSDQHGGKPGPHCRRAGGEKLATRNCLMWIVDAMSTEVHDVIRIIAAGSSPDHPGGHGSGP